MVRLHAYIVFGVAGLAAATWCFEPSSLPTTDEGMTSAVANFNRQRREFEQRCQGWMKDLKTGSVSLREVATRAREYCEVFYPSYLSGLAVVWPGNSDEERIASNLVHALECEIHDQPGNTGLREAHRRRQRELQNWGG